MPEARGSAIFHRQQTRTLSVQSKGDETGGRSGDDGRKLRAVDGAVERVAFHGDAAGRADEALEFGARSKLGGLRAGIVIDLLFDDGAVQIVCAKMQRNLSDAGRKHNPVGLDMVEIVEKKTRDGDVAQVI